MRVFVAIAASAIVVAACGGTAAAPSPTPTTTPTVAPTPTPSPTPSNVFKATLKTANENPPITDAEASCSGDATITFTGTSVKFDVSFAGCPASAVINIGHIHEGAGTANGPVKIDSSLKAGELTLMPDPYAMGVGGTLSRTVTADATLISTIMANPVGYYVNFHTTAHPAGVMRGQLTKG